jgi:hypothetical protein
MRTEHATQLRDLKTSFKKELQLLRKRFDGQLRNERENQRKVFEKQKSEFQRGQETIAKNHLREVIQNYSNLASTYQDEIERFRRIQHERDTEMSKKDSEIVQLKLELAKATSDIQAKRMILRLAERNALIERLQSRIEELEIMIARPPGHDEESQVESEWDKHTAPDIVDGEAAERQRVETKYLPRPDVESDLLLPNRIVPRVINARSRTIRGLEDL